MVMRNANTRTDFEICRETFTTVFRLRPEIGVFLREFLYWLTTRWKSLRIHYNICYSGACKSLICLFGVIEKSKNTKQSNPTVASEAYTHVNSFAPEG